MRTLSRLPWITGFSFLCFFLLPVLTRAEIPRQLSYYGLLSDSSGNPLVGAHSITFRLYDDLSTGSRLWEESHQVNLDKGIFQVVLGMAQPLDITFDRPLWISLEVNREGEMSPRLPLVSVGYALNAASLNSVPAANFLRSDHGGEIQGSLSVQGMLLVQDKPVMVWDQRSILMVGLVSLACGALGGILVFTLARLFSSSKKS